MIFPSFLSEHLKVSSSSFIAQLDSTITQSSGVSIIQDKDYPSLLSSASTHLSFSRSVNMNADSSTAAATTTAIATASTYEENINPFFIASTVSGSFPSQQLKIGEAGSSSSSSNLPSNAETASASSFFISKISDNLTVTTANRPFYPGSSTFSQATCETWPIGVLTSPVNTKP